MDAATDGIACVAGTYAGLGQTHCQTCHPGSYTDTLAGIGATGCTACGLGHSNNNSTENCTRVPGLYGTITLNVIIEDWTNDERDALASAIASSIATAVGVSLSQVRVDRFTGIFAPPRNVPEKDALFGRQVSHKVVLLALLAPLPPPLHQVVRS